MKISAPQWIYHYLPIGFALTFFVFPIADIQPYKEFFLYSTIFLGLWYYNDRINFSLLKPLKIPLVLIAVFLSIALISLIFSVDPYESLKKIKVSIIENVFMLILIYLICINFDQKSYQRLFYGIGAAFSIHAIINIVLWQQNGGFPYRSGGLLDTPGGEMFGIWAAFFLAYSVALTIYYHKKLGVFLLLLALVSIIANNTRATYIGVLAMLTFAPFFLAYSRRNKIILSTAILLGSVCFYSLLGQQVSENKHDYTKIFSKLELIVNMPPAEMEKLDRVYGMDGGIAIRLSLWKSAMLSILQNPLLPRGYGQDLYLKTLKQENQNTPENLPYEHYPQLHNDFLGMWYALGFIGLLAFTGFFIYTIRTCINVSQCSKNNLDIAFSVFIGLGIVTEAVAMFFGTYFTGSEAKIIFMLMAIITALYVRNKIPSSA